MRHDVPGLDEDTSVREKSPPSAKTHGAIIGMLLLVIFVATFSSLTTWTLLSTHGSRWGVSGLVSDLSDLDDTAATIEFDRRIRSAFPVGTDQGRLLMELRREGFAPPWHWADGERFLELDVLSGLFCAQKYTVRWQVSQQSIYHVSLITDIAGARENRCTYP